MTEGRVALVTGASSGFGRRTAAMLAKKGLRVFGTSRNPKETTVDGFEMLRLDVDSDDSVSSCLSTVLEKAGKVDVLVNSAGYELTGALEETSMEEARAQLETNFWGTVRMVDAVLPPMRKRRSGQIVNIGSLAGTFPVPFQGFYAVTKAALVAYTQTLRYELQQFGIRVSIVEPGFFDTNFAGAGKTAAHPIDDYKEVKERALSKLLKDLNEGGDPSVVAETIIKIIESPSPRLRYPVGKEKRYLLLRRLVPSSTMESGLARHYGISE